MKKLFLFFILNLFLTNIYADSPLTSTDFFKAYTAEPIVKKALSLKKGKITTDILLYLADSTNPIDIKLATINALGWNVKGKNNSKAFLHFVLKNKNYNSEFHKDILSFTWHANAEELICYSYLKAMDNYFDISSALGYAELALKKDSNSFSINMIYRLIKAQGLTSLNEACLAFYQFNSLKTDNLKNDMNRQAMIYVFEYLDDIGKDCKR
jgi:hypothetical protein